MSYAFSDILRRIFNKPHLKMEFLQTNKTLSPLLHGSDWNDGGADEKDILASLQPLLKKGATPDETTDIVAAFLLLIRLSHLSYEEAQSFDFFVKRDGGEVRFSIYHPKDKQKQTTQAKELELWMTCLHRADSILKKCSQERLVEDIIRNAGNIICDVLIKYNLTSFRLCMTGLGRADISSS